MPKGNVKEMAVSFSVVRQVHRNFMLSSLGLYIFIETDTVLKSSKLSALLRFTMLYIVKIERIP